MLGCTPPDRSSQQPPSPSFPSGWPAQCGIMQACTPLWGLFYSGWPHHPTGVCHLVQPLALSGRGCRARGGKGLWCLCLWRPAAVLRPQDGRQQADFTGRSHRNKGERNLVESSDQGSAGPGGGWSCSLGPGGIWLPPCSWPSRLLFPCWSQPSAAPAQSLPCVLCPSALPASSSPVLLTHPAHPRDRVTIVSPSTMSPRCPPGPQALPKEGWAFASSQPSPFHRACNGVGYLEGTVGGRNCDCSFLNSLVGFSERMPSWELGKPSVYAIL